MAQGLKNSHHLKSPLARLLLSTMKGVVALLVSGAYGHGSMTLPRPRNAGNSSVHPSPGQDKSCEGDACYWYHVGCYIGCPECSGEGKSLYPQPYCSNPIEPTNNDPETRSWDPLGQSKHGDFTKYNPWRAPGKAPVTDACGVASGYHHPSAYADIPAGYHAYDMGSKVLPAGAPTYWKAGGTAEVGWALSAQHGGGYTYRLCPKSESLNEACFQSHPLSFAAKNSTVRYHDGSKQDFQIPVANLESSGMHWRRNPIPGCSCDLGWGCRQSSDEVSIDGTSGHSHVQGVVDKSPYAHGGPPTPACPYGTMFDAGWTPEGEGFLVGSSNVFSIIDEIQVPNTPGEYVLGWRWDCEQTDQVWNSCADIVITNDVPPTPAPTPSPPGPAPKPPKPSPSKACKTNENPTCKGSFTSEKSCWFGGCRTCHDDTSFDCDECCSGCSRTSKSGKSGSIHYCTWTKSNASGVLV